MRNLITMIAFSTAVALGNFDNKNHAEQDLAPIVDSTSTTQVTVSSDTTSTASGQEYIDTPLDSLESNGSSQVTIDLDKMDNLDGTMKWLGVGAATGGILIAMLALFVIFGLPILLIALILMLIFRSRNKENRMRYEMAQAYLKQGEKVPEALITKPEPANGELYEKAIKNICLGAGLTIFFYYFFDSMAFASIGLIVLLQGVGQYIISKKRGNGQQAQQPKAETAQQPEEKHPATSSDDEPQAEA